MTLRETILLDVMSKLNGVSKPVGVPTARRAFQRGIAPDSLSTVDVYFDSEEVVEYVGHVSSPVLAKRHLTISVEIKTKGSATTTPEQAADPIADWVVQALAGAQQNGLYHLVREASTEWDYDAADHDYMLVAVKFVVEYQTKAADLATWA